MVLTMSSLISNVVELPYRVQKNEDTVPLKKKCTNSIKIRYVVIGSWSLFAAAQGC